MISLPRAALRPPAADFALPWADLLCPFGAEAFIAQSLGAAEEPVIRPVASNVKAASGCVVFMGVSIILRTGRR